MSRQSSTKGFLLQFKNVHIFIPVKGIYITYKVRLNKARQLLEHVEQNPELITKLGLTKDHLHLPTFDRLILDRSLCIKMYDVIFEIRPRRHIRLTYKNKPHLARKTIYYKLGKIRVINV